MQWSKSKMSTGYSPYICTGCKTRNIKENFLQMFTSSWETVLSRFYGGKAEGSFWEQKPTNAKEGCDIPTWRTPKRKVTICQALWLNSAHRQVEFSSFSVFITWAGCQNLKIGRLHIQMQSTFLTSFEKQVNLAYWCHVPCASAGSARVHALPTPPLFPSPKPSFLLPTYHLFAFSGRNATPASTQSPFGAEGVWPK